MMFDNIVPDSTVYNVKTPLSALKMLASEYYEIG